MADEDPDALDQLLDAALFAPFGMLLEMRDRSPELAARGRQHLQTQISVARMVGQFAVQMGSRQLSAFLQRQRESASSDTEATGPDPAAAPTDGTLTVEDTVALGNTVTIDEPASAPVPSGPLPIEGYDTLAASQVVARLDGLDAAGLEAVRAYEAAHRNRKTILGKVAQLQRAG